MLSFEGFQEVETLVLLSNETVTVVSMSYGKIEIYKSQFAGEKNEWKRLYLAKEFLVPYFPNRFGYNV